MKTWADLLGALRDQNAYEGDGTLADVQKFLNDNDIKVMGDLSGLFARSKATKGQKVVKIEATAGEEVELVAPAVEAEMADEEDDQEEMPAKRAPAPARKSTPHRIPDIQMRIHRLDFTG